MRLSSGSFTDVRRSVLTLVLRSVSLENLELVPFCLGSRFKLQQPVTLVELKWDGKQFRRLGIANPNATRQFCVATYPSFAVLSRHHVSDDFSRVYRENKGQTGEYSRGAIER